MGVHVNLPGVSVEEKDKDITTFDEKEHVYLILQHTTHGKMCVVPFAMLITSNTSIWTTAW